MSDNNCVICGKLIPEGRMICRICENVEPSFETKKIRVYLNQIEDISKFIELVSKCSGDVVIRSGNFAVNAKSIMGLFSLDLTRTLQVEFYGDVPHEVQEGMKKFIVN